MNYFLLKLAFDTAVHFGGSDSAVGSQSSALTLRADTIFSALCHTALEVYGEPALEELLISADADALRISDAMPWRGDSFYLPKPIAASTSPAELSTVERKAVKKLAWIPVSKFDRYTASPFSKRSADEVVDCPASGNVTPRASSTSLVIPTKSATFAMPT